ncbi:MAG: hypothetical protein IJ845_03735 [Bacteroidaceae bacterium]|nr:hypothetical protein [Bacteroidaceae bacterium]
MEKKKMKEETLAEEAKQNEVKKEVPKKLSWRKVSIGGTAAILFGGAATALMGFIDANDIEGGIPSTQENNEVQVPHSNATVDGLPIAKSVTDSMSFGEAFAAARNETGAGGIFSWRGGVYGTYLADEWDAMTHEEQVAFGSRVHYGAGNVQNTIAESSSGSEAEELISEAVIEVEPNSEKNDYESDPEVEAESTSDVDIVADIPIEKEDSVEVIEEAQADTEVETLETDVFIPSMEQTHDELQQIDDLNDITSAGNGPDYVNDADISGFELV